MVFHMAFHMFASGSVEEAVPIFLAEEPANEGREKPKSLEPMQT